MRTIIRRLAVTLAALAMAAGMGAAGTVLTAGAASASPPPVTNHCPLWANFHLYGPYVHCYANETPAEMAPYFYAY